MYPVTEKRAIIILRVERLSSQVRMFPVLGWTGRQENHSKGLELRLGAFVRLALTQNDD